VALIFPGERLIERMDAETVKRLGLDLRDAVRDLEKELSPMMKAVSIWWKWYEAIPKMKEKNFPFVGASNVVVPMIGIACDALTSRSLAQATAAAPTYWLIESENEYRRKIAMNMKRYINWQANGNDFSIKHVLMDQLLETYVTGRGCAAIHYRRDVRPMWFGRTPPGKRPRLKQMPVTFARGPMIEHVPREHLLWDLRYRIGDAPIVARTHHYAWTTLRDMANLDEAWDKAAVDYVRKFPGIDEGDAIQIEKTKLDLNDQAIDPLSNELHDVREVWIDWSMLGGRFEVPGDESMGGMQVPLVAHLHMQTGKLLRLVGMPYLLPYKPFVDFKFRAGRGVAKRLEMLQLIQTTVWNQSLDARTRSNAMWGVTRNARHTKTPMDPSKLMLVDDMGEIAALNFPSHVQQDLPLMTAAQTMAERWVGQSDPLLGRDTRSGGHPAPATSTLALLEQVNVMSAGTDVILQEEISRMGEAIAILDQQFENNEDGKLQLVLGQEDAAAIGEYLFPDEPIPGNYWFDVAAISRTENPDTAMQRTLMTAQAYQNYGALVAQGAQILDAPQASPRTKAVWAKLMDAMGDLLERFLDASNVDQGERYLVELNQLGVDSRNAFQQFVREAAGPNAPGRNGAGGAAGGGGGSVSAAGVAVGAPNGVGGREGAPFTGGGVLQ